MTWNSLFAFSVRNKLHTVAVFVHLYDNRWKMSKHAYPGRSQDKCFLSRTFRNSTQHWRSLKMHGHHQTISDILPYTDTHFKSICILKQDQNKRMNKKVFPKRRYLIRSMCLRSSEYRFFSIMRKLEKCPFSNLSNPKLKLWGRQVTTTKKALKESSWS